MDACFLVAFSMRTRFHRENSVAIFNTRDSATSLLRSAKHMRSAVWLKRVSVNFSVQICYRDSFHRTKIQQFPQVVLWRISLKMAENGEHTGPNGQVQVHFTTNSPDIELPEDKRQLLVPTSMRLSNSSTHLGMLTRYRCSQICPLTNSQFRVYARHLVARSLRLPHQRPIPAYNDRRIPYFEWTLFRNDVESTICAKFDSASIWDELRAWWLG